MWFPGVEGIVAHCVGEWEDRAWVETHIQSGMTQYAEPISLLN